MVVPAMAVTVALVGVPPHTWHVLIATMAKIGVTAMLTGTLVLAIAAVGCWRNHP